MSAQPLILASGSPRRTELLRQVGIPHEVRIGNVDESRLPKESDREHVQRLARDKARWGFNEAGGERAVLGADTIVMLGDELLGKPCDRAHARSMLRQLSGGAHEVWSAVALATPGGEMLETLAVSTVHFGEMPDAFIVAYCEGPEPMDKAGAYAVQGLTARYIRRIEGSYSGVMGLPLFETVQLLTRAGLLDARP